MVSGSFFSSFYFWPCPPFHFLSFSLPVYALLLSFFSQACCPFQPQGLGRYQPSLFHVLVEHLCVLCQELLFHRLLVLFSPDSSVFASPLRFFTSSCSLGLVSCFFCSSSCFVFVASPSRGLLSVSCFADAYVCRKETLYFYCFICGRTKPNGFCRSPSYRRCKDHAAGLCRSLVAAIGWRNRLGTRVAPLQ